MCEFQLPTMRGAHNSYSIECNKIGLRSVTRSLSATTQKNRLHHWGKKGAYCSLPLWNVFKRNNRKNPLHKITLHGANTQVHRSSESHNPRETRIKAKRLCKCEQKYSYKGHQKNVEEESQNGVRRREKHGKRFETLCWGQNMKIRLFS